MKEYFEICLQQDISILSKNKKHQIRKYVENLQNKIKNERYQNQEIENNIIIYNHNEL